MDFNLSLAISDPNFSVLAASLAPGQLPGLGWFTNSILFALLVTVAVLLFTRMATRKMKSIPDQKQNFVEFVIEFLYNQAEGIVGKQVAPQVFPILATIFIFVLASNWAGLLPGVGTVGVAGGPEYMAGPLTIKADHGQSESYPQTSTQGEKPRPAFTALLRPPSADLNFTLAVACVFMVIWAWVTLKEVGLLGFLEHTFAPKGGLSGYLKLALIPVFFFVGIIEMISIAARPVSLSLRLFGNVYAGEELLHTMLHLGENFGLEGVPLFILSVVVPLPFYFLEILVGILQATVFALLCAVFIKLSTAHEEH